MVNNIKQPQKYQPFSCGAAENIAKFPFRGYPIPGRLSMYPRCIKMILEKLYRYNTNIKESVGGLSDTQSTILTSGSNSSGPSKSNSTGPSLMTPLNAL